jgi:cation transport ATPase
MDPEEYKEITPEQKKEIAKIFSKGRISLVISSFKFAILLFGANLISIIIGFAFLKDADPSTRVYFEYVIMFINFIFSARYLDRQLKANTDTVMKKIKEVLKKS